jgi:hypothetical protein
MAVEANAHHVEGLSLVPVGGRPDRHDARDALAVLEPDLNPDDRRASPDREQVVVDGESGRLRLGRSGVPLRAQRVDVAAGRRAVVAGDLALAPAEVVDRCDVG